MTANESIRNAAPALLALALGVAACGDNRADSTLSDASSDVASTEGPPTVLLAERVNTPDGLRYVISLLPEVPSAAVDRSKALVLTSADIELFNDRVYIRDRKANTITRYAVSADRTLVQDGEPFSFAGVGLGTGRTSNVYIAPDRAYAMDPLGWRLIGWNPTTMALTGEIISIANMKKDAALPVMLAGAISPAVKVGDRLVAAVNWEDLGRLVMYPGSGALVIDPASPASPVFIEDARVGGAFRISADAAGNAFMTGTVGGDVRNYCGMFCGGALPASGIIELPAGQTAFDPAYLVDVEAITHSKSVWAIHRLDATTLLAQIYDPALDLPATFAEYNASTDFMYVVIDTAAGTFTPVAGLPKGGRGNAGNHVVDGTLYVQQANAAGTGSVVYAATAAGLTEAFPVPAGDVWLLQRFR